MDDSDDYFNDSFVLNDDDLALLDAEEERHTLDNSEEVSRQAQLIKRRKVLHRHEDEGPDISVQWNGTYGVNTDFGVLYEDKVLQYTNAPKPTHDQVNINQKTQLETFVDTGPGIATEASSRNLPPRSRNSNAVTSTSRERSNINYTGIGDLALNDEVAQLRAQIETLMHERDQSKSALKDLETVRLAKEGEVSILRKRVEKAAEQHAVDAQKLTELKENAEAEKVKLQKEMNIQKERLQTELAFKKHEADSASRRPMSTRSKRIGGGYHPSPVRATSPMRHWGGTNRPILNKASNEKEILRSRGDTQDASQQRSSRFVRPTEAKFSGFENTFLQSSPTKSPSRRRGVKNTQEGSSVDTPSKNGAREARNRRTNELFTPVRAPPASLCKEPKEMSISLPADDTIQEFDVYMDVGGSSPSRRPRENGIESSPALDRADFSSILGSDLVEETEENSNSEPEAFEGIDWLDELHSMLFSHESIFSDVPTFQFLLSAPASSQNRYQESCSAILEALGTKYKYLLFNDLLDDIMKSLLTMPSILWDLKLYKHLGALFDLLNSVTVQIPDSAPSIKRSSSDGQDPLLVTVKKVTMASIESCIDNSEIQPKLTQMALTLFESLAWLLPDHQFNRFVDVARDDHLFCSLLGDKQTFDVQKLALQLLVLLATHPQLCDSFIAPLTHDVPSQPSLKNSSRLPLLEKMCTFLVPEKDSCNYDLTSLVLTFFASVISANAECRSAVQSRTNLIHYLVSYLSRLTCFIWEDAESSSPPTDAAFSVIGNMQQCVYLLHQLVFASVSGDSAGGDDINIDLRQKLYHAPPQMFNGLAHMFIVMISRLSYADPPEWLSAELQTQVLKLTEPARDLMDLIVEGPESDRIWAVYQTTKSDGDPIATDLDIGHSSLEL